LSSDRTIAALSFSLLELKVLAGLSQGLTLSQIGEQLHFSQSTVSKVLRTAERTSAMPLVEHRGRRVQLTGAGAEIAQSARLVLAQMHGLERLVEDLQSGKTGRLRIAATMTPAGFVVPSALADFRQSYPEVEVSLQVVGGATWRVLLNEGLDLGVGTHPTAPVGWKAEELYRDPVTFFVPRGSAFDSLDRAPVIAPWSRPFWSRILSKLTEQGVEVPQRMDLHPMDGVKDLVEAGCGVGALLQSAVWRDLRDGRFVELSVPDVNIAPPFYLITPDVRHPLDVVEAFSASLRRRVDQMFGEKPD
jgi:DNA-binding transcriptional LysR family regulator